MSCDTRDKDPWVRIAITAVHIFDGFDNDEKGERRKRVIIQLGGTSYFTPENFLIDKGITLEVGAIVEVEYFGPEIGNIRMSDEDERNHGLIAS